MSSDYFSKNLLEGFCINYAYVMCFETTELDLSLVVFYSTCVMNTCTQMTG